MNFEFSVLSVAKHCKELSSMILYCKMKCILS